jgi:hypothetical protein
MMVICAQFVSSSASISGGPGSHEEGEPSLGIGINFAQANLLPKTGAFGLSTFQLKKS